MWRAAGGWTYRDVMAWREVPEPAPEVEVTECQNKKN